MVGHPIDCQKKKYCAPTRAPHGLTVSRRAGTFDYGQFCSNARPASARTNRLVVAGRPDSVLGRLSWLGLS